MLDTTFPRLQEGDLIAISAKVVSIHEGRCLPMCKVEKDALVRKEADLVIPRTDWRTPITVKYHALLGSSGIDESNGNGYFILLPEDPFRSAQGLYEHLTHAQQLKNLGIILTDSQSDLFRFGATGVAIGWWGFEPLIDHRGMLDIFGRAIKTERSNLVDVIAVAATVVAGEVARHTPIVIVRDVPDVSFINKLTKAEVLATFAEDKFRDLYKTFLP